MPAERRGWWRTYFDDAYFHLHDPLFGEAASRAEVAGMRELLGLPWDARVLDAPCGWGRHTRLLAEAGSRAFGADLSLPLLRRARGPGRVAGPTFTAADVRALPFASGVFDAVLNVFTSLGLFLDDVADRAVLSEARRVLRPGGSFLLESMHRDDVVAAYAERDEWTLPDGTLVRVRRRFDPVAGVSHETLHWQRGPARGRKQHSLRLRTATEIAGLLTAAGFTDIAYFGDWQGHPFRHDSSHLIAVARSSA